MPKLYYIPGMGTDERVFQRLAPLLPDAFEPHYLLHQPPKHAKEPLVDYAARLAETLEPEPTPPTFLGLSLGGPIALELARRTPNARVILLSTFKGQQERPLFFSVAQHLPLHQLIPYDYTRRMVPRLARWSGLATAEESQLLRDMFDASNALHFAWGREAIVHWSNTWLPEHWLHINGTLDHIFQRANPKATHLIQGGTHNMVLNRAEELALLITDFLQQVY